MAGQPHLPALVQHAGPKITLQFCAHFEALQLPAPPCPLPLPMHMSPIFV
jgi:hypothetical protein